MDLVVNGDTTMQLESYIGSQPYMGVFKSSLHLFSYYTIV